jgi:sigma54-dependent transcription regulator
MRNINWALTAIFSNAMRHKRYDVPEELLVSLLVDSKKPVNLIGENGLLKQFAKRRLFLLSRARSSYDHIS